jgi:hypothetical protein
MAAESRARYLPSCSPDAKSLQQEIKMDPFLFADPNPDTFYFPIGGSPVGGYYPGALGISDVTGALGIPIDWYGVDAYNQGAYFNATYASSVYDPAGYLGQSLAAVQYALSPF